MSWKCLVLAMLIGLVGCNETEPNIAQRQQSKPRQVLVKRLTLLQYVPKQQKKADFGFQMMAPLAAEIMQTESGYVVKGDQITIIVEKWFPSQQSPVTQTWKLQSTENSFWSWGQAGNDWYQIQCQGEVDEKLCNEVLTSLQIINR